MQATRCNLYLIMYNSALGVKRQRSEDGATADGADLLCSGSRICLSAKTRMQEHRCPLSGVPSALRPVASPTAYDQD
jgi:hypothetical protein